jgi:hypothetical protein
MRSRVSYERPDPFDPLHLRSVDTLAHTAGELDSFDHRIGFGSRRERLRQNFEWELDRLYPAEETDRRRRETIANGKEKHRRAEKKSRKQIKTSSRKQIPNQWRRERRVAAIPQT